MTPSCGWYQISPSSSPPSSGLYSTFTKESHHGLTCGMIKKEQHWFTSYELHEIYDISLISATLLLQCMGR